jgi:hypothetical protein
MEDAIISLAPAGLQFIFILLFAFDHGHRFEQTRHVGDLFISVGMLAFLPFCVRRLRTAWRTRAFTAPATR